MGFLSKPQWAWGIDRTIFTPSFERKSFDVVRFELVQVFRQHEGERWLESYRRWADGPSFGVYFEATHGEFLRAADDAGFAIANQPFRRPVDMVEVAQGELTRHDDDADADDDDDDDVEPLAPMQRGVPDAVTAIGEPLRRTFTFWILPHSAASELGYQSYSAESAERDRPVYPRQSVESEARARRVEGSRRADRPQR